MLVGLPANAAFGKHVVIPRNAQADGAITLVRDARIFERIEIQVDDVIERAHRRAHHVAHSLFAFHRKTSERKARKVAHDEITRTRGGHHHGISVLGLRFHRHAFNRRHILRDFGAQVAAVNNAFVRIRVCPVDDIAIERKRCARLHGALQNEAHDISNDHRALGNARVGHAVEVTLLPFVAEIVF